MASSYDVLIQKLDEFTRKYYKNRILRGLIYSTALILGFYLSVALLEYFGRFNSGTRTLLFWSFIGASAFILYRFVLSPLFRLLKLGKQISHQEAAKIIGKHFNEVSDKLLNTLQLQNMSATAGSDHSLIQASIDQKIGELRPVPFAAAVDFSENRKYLRYVLPPLAIIVVLLFAAPSILTDSTSRLVKYDEEITLEAPYSISLINENLEVPENEDFQLRVKLDGKVIPDKLYIVVNGSRFKLNKDDKTNFNYTFRDVRSNQEFSFYADGFYSQEYELLALPVPALVQFRVELDYPDYTGLKDEELRNSGDLSVPAGTRVKWKFETRNSEKLNFFLGDSLIVLDPGAQDAFSFEQRLLNNLRYALQPIGETTVKRDSISYSARVIADRYPSIEVSEETDSLSRKDVYFTGEVNDDYGFKRLSFAYSFVKSEVEGRVLNEVQRVELRVNPNTLTDRFYHHWNLRELNIQPGESISYFFEIWDNDGVNGSKSSRSRVLTYSAPSLDELQEQEEAKNEEIKDEIDQSLKDAKKLQKELDQLRKEMLEKEKLSWQDRKKIEDVLEKQKQLRENVEKIQQQNEEKNQKRSEFEQPNESLLQKQEQLQKLFDELMTEEMKQMYEELQQLMEELNKDEIQKQLEKMDMSSEDMEKELDRALEQFKQMEWEQKMEETIDKLNELAKEQEKLAEESEAGEKDADELKKEQDELNKEFEELKEDLNKLEEMNEELENPNSMPDTEEKQESIQEEMQKSSEELEKNKPKKAGESQQNASDEMKEMAQQMQMAMEQGQSESMEENMDDLRDLLENIITLSFDQETLMEDFRVVDRKDPKYVQYGKQQRKLKDDTRMVEDSLFALAKRVIHIEPVVLKEIRTINERMDAALEQIGERQTPLVTENQQYVMTSFNNLALLLDEALKQMQQQMANQQPGTGNCQKPGGMGKKPSMSQMKKMQDALSKQLEQMKNQQGQQGKDGKQQPRPQPGMSEQVAKMAAQQAAIRREVEKMSQQLNEDGSGSGNGLKEIAKEMEELEKDLVNMRVDEATLRRQQDILTRLLRAENAEREREMDEKRQSNEALQELISNPMRYSEYKEKKERELELLKTVPPGLKPYYRDRVNDYFNKLGD